VNRARAFAAGVALVAATAAVVWWPGSQQGLPGAVDPRSVPGAAAAPTGGAGQSLSARPMESSFFATRRATDPDRSEDPLLVHGLRDTLEALLTEALEDGATDPAALKQRLAALVGKHFPAALATRALALAERYVDYRVALGQLRPPQDPNDPGALREALEVRHKVRQQFFDGPEHDALFAREAELDRYTLARLEIERNPQLTAEQRAQALRDAENELPAARRAERAATTEHLNAAAQTAAFNAQNTDERTRHAARSAQYGEAAAHAMAQLDREEQHWQQRLDQYNQARGQQGEGPALQQLRQQLFSAEEQQRIDAALALRRLPPAASGS
jgi:lipase chaperone LimK